MAAALRSSTTVAVATRTNTTFTAPAGIQDGDLLLIFLQVGAAAAVTPTPPTGFSTATGFPIEMSKADPWTSRGYCFYKIASAESGNYTCSHTSASSDGVMEAWSGADTTTPLSPNPTTNTGTGSTSTALGLTTPRDSSGVIFYSIAWDGQGGAAPTGTTPTFTERFDSGATGTSYAADGVLATAGATGNKSNGNNNTPGQPWAAALVCVQAAASGPANFNATGALAAQAAAVAGSAVVGRTSTGALAAGSAAVAGTATVGRTATAALAAQSATIAGTASVAEPPAPAIFTSSFRPDVSIGQFEIERRRKRKVADLFLLLLG